MSNTEFIIWREETFLVPYRFKVDKVEDAIKMLEKGEVDQVVNGNNLNMADCVWAETVAITKVKPSEKLEQESEACEDAKSS